MKIDFNDAATPLAELANSYLQSPTPENLEGLVLVLCDRVERLENELKLLKGGPEPAFEASDASQDMVEAQTAAHNQ